MTSELFFIYDSHCPWSYASTKLVSALKEAHPTMEIRTLHCAHYDGSDTAGFKQVEAVKQQSNVKFGRDYIRYADSPKNSTLCANFMAWLQNKQAAKALDVLISMQRAHFAEGNPFGCKHDFNHIVEHHRLSPPNKVFKDALTNDAQYVVSDVSEFQEFIGTTSFPALLLVIDEKAVLLNHSLYLDAPEKFIEAVELEMK